MDIIIYFYTINSVFHCLYTHKIYYIEQVRQFLKYIVLKKIEIIKVYKLH
jgi:hypothetical protein